MKKDIEIEEKKKSAGLTKKFSDVSKKVLGGIQQGVKNFSENSQKKHQENKLKKLNPLFLDTFNSEDFHVPNVINIVDDAQRRDEELCEGAIGWREKVDDVEVLFLYDEYVKESQYMFVPFAACDAVYCVDPFEKGKFINTDIAFERTLNEKLAELEHVAYCLGAKSCSIEIVDMNSDTSSYNGKFNSKAVNASSETTTSNTEKKSLKNVTHFEGNEKTKTPKLKWFAYDENINGLIEMRRSGKNAIKSKILELYCSTSATMSAKSAVAVDKIKKVKIGGEFSATVKSNKEHTSKLIFEIQF